VLDGLLGNATDLPVFAHATDTHGASLANFALFDLVGKQLSPRIRDLGKITLYRTGPRQDFLTRYPRCGPLMTRRLNTDLITATWDDLLRVAASVQGGHATAALVVGKLCSSKRQQNALTSAIKEYGALRRTVYAARYPADETYRRRIARQLNKGENLHALRRSLSYAAEGALRRMASSPAWNCRPAAVRIGPVRVPSATSRARALVLRVSTSRCRSAIMRTLAGRAGAEAARIGARAGAFTSFAPPARLVSAPFAPFAPSGSARFRAPLSALPPAAAARVWPDTTIDIDTPAPSADQSVGDTRRSAHTCSAP